jgi:putative membrane protein
VEALPPILRYLGYTSAGLLLLAFAIAMLRLSVLYFRLRRSPTLRIDSLQLLAQRQMVRSAHIRRAFTHVFDSLRPIVVEYPVDHPAIARLRVWGADDAQIADLQAARERLLLRHEGPEEWIEGFRVRFLPPLDEIARRRIRRAATTAGKLTAISPRGAIDAIVVAALAIELVSDLCAIYSLKANRVETIQILGRVFLAAGIASQADDWTESASEGIFESLDLDAMPGVLSKLFSKMAVPIVGAVADGAINAALIWRIGRRTVRAVRPLA